MRSAAPVAPPAIVQQADRFELARCRCPTCLVLDGMFPGAFQLALFPYVRMGKPRTPRVAQHIVVRR